MPSIAAENEITVKNLLAAFEGESNASAKYIAFAVRADEDGFMAPPACSAPRAAPSRFMPPIMRASSSSWAVKCAARFIKSKSKPRSKT